MVLLVRLHHLYRQRLCRLLLVRLFLRVLVRLDHLFLVVQVRLVLLYLEVLELQVLHDQEDLQEDQVDHDLEDQLEDHVLAVRQVDHDQLVQIHLAVQMVDLFLVVLQAGL